MKSKAKFSKKVKEEIYERDGWCCVICWSNQRLQFHHVYFWMEAKRTPERNNANQWVTLDDLCHLDVHSCPSGEGIRQDCILYLKELW